MDITVTTNGRKRVLPLHRWRERVDSETIAVIMRVETISNGIMYAFECFTLTKAEDYWRLDHEFATEFLHRLKIIPYNKAWGGLDLPMVRDLRRED